MAKITIGTASLVTSQEDDAKEAAEIAAILCAHEVRMTELQNARLGVVLTAMGPYLDRLVAAIERSAAASVAETEATLELERTRAEEEVATSRIERAKSELDLKVRMAEAEAKVEAAKVLNGKVAKAKKVTQDQGYDGSPRFVYEFSDGE